MKKPALLYYCQSTDGLGGLGPALAIARRLAHRFRVVILNGGPPQPATTIPQDVEIVQLPPLQPVAGTKRSARNTSMVWKRDQVTRAETIVSRFRALKPHVLLIETYPFGPRSLADELLPLIDAASGSPFNRPFIICSVKDIVSGNENGKEKQDDKSAKLLEKNFDAVIVHSDPSFSRFQEFFQPRNALTTPIYHTGFVMQDRKSASRRAIKEKRVLVAAGSGSTGMALCQAAAEAHRILWEVDHLPMTIVAGADIPQPDWKKLKLKVDGLPAIKLRRSVADLGAEFAKVRWAVCQSDYVTAIDVLASGVAALLVPAHENSLSEQTIRAQRLSNWRAAQMLMPRHLNDASLANGIHQLVKFRPLANSFNMDGAEITSNLVYHLSLSEDVRAEQLVKRTRSERPHPH